MYLRVLDLCLIVSAVSEPREASAIKVDRERGVACDQGVKSQIKFFASNQKRIADVPLDDVGFG
jgi:hypothetical protein